MTPATGTGLFRFQDILEPCLQRILVVRERGVLGYFGVDLVMDLGAGTSCVARVFLGQRNVSIGFVIADEAIVNLPTVSRR